MNQVSGMDDDKRGTVLQRDFLSLQSVAWLLLPCSLLRLYEHFELSK